MQNSDSEKEFFNNKFQELERNIKCPCCNNFYIGTHRPYLLKCGHCICSECIKLNSINYTCLLCLANYTSKDLINLPVNFLIDEIILKLSTNKIMEITNENYKGDTNTQSLFFCVNCNTLMSFLASVLHKESFNFHSVISHEKMKNNQTKFYNLKVDKMLEIIKKELLEQINEFSHSIVEKLKEKLNKDQVLIEENKLNLLSIIDIVSHKEVGLFNFFKNLQKSDFANEEELIKIVKVNNLIDSKFAQVGNKLIEMWNNIKSENNFSEDLADEVVNYFRNVIYSDLNDKGSTQLCHIKQNNEEEVLVVYIYDYLTNKFFKIKINLQEIDIAVKNISIKNPSISSDGLDKLFLTFDDKFYIITYNNINETVQEIKTEAKPLLKRGKHLSYYTNFKLFLIGGDEMNNIVEYFDFVYGMWIRLPATPFAINHPRVFCLGHKLLIFNSLKKCCYFDLNKFDDWKEIKLLYEDLCYTATTCASSELNNYVLILESKNEDNFQLKIVGGFFISNTNTNDIIYNDKVFSFNFLQGTVTQINDAEIKMSFQISSSSNSVILGENEKGEVLIEHF